MDKLTPPSEVAQLRQRVAELEVALAGLRPTGRLGLARPSGASLAEVARLLGGSPVKAPAMDRSPVEWAEPDQVALADAFHRLWYDHGDQTWRDTHWMGHQLYKLPLDLWVYQELLWKVRPTVLVECGTYRGGSALYFASLFELIGSGRVISIDVEEHGVRPEHPRIRYLLGSTVGDEVFAAVRADLSEDDTVMVILDSDHSADHVRAELERYAPLVSPDSYVIVEDSNVNGHPVVPGYGPGPMEALTGYFDGRDDFELDPWCERYLMSFARRGFWRRRP